MHGCPPAAEMSLAASHVYFSHNIILFVTLSPAPDDGDDDANVGRTTCCCCTACDSRTASSNLCKYKLPNPAASTFDLIATRMAATCV